MSLKQWLTGNGLDVLYDKISDLDLQTLSSMNEQDSASILPAFGLNCDEIHQLMTALSHNNNNINQMNMDHNEIKDDCDYPVLPLIIPNNVSYDAHSKKAFVNEQQQRDKLKIYEPALEFIRNIRCKVATISIVGRTRTGKSLVAGELYAAQRIPCPFDLGHLHDACTYGVWVTGKTIKHPDQNDTVILILDVEGTGHTQSNQHNDLQLMVITLLISSYFIYNSKGTFDTPCLEEIKFITELTQKIRATPNDDSGDDFKKFFPVFMWLLRDAHLEATIDKKQVSIRQYFTDKVLKYEMGMNQNVLQRQQVRSVFLQMFQDYDAFALPMPHSNKNVLQHLGTMPRNQLEPAFNQKLKEFCHKVVKTTKCKALFTKKPNGDDQFVLCTGFHLAEWIEQCIKYVNDPNKIPQISSMTQAVMSSVYRKSKNEARRAYEQLLLNGLTILRNGDDKQPLNESDIIELHLTIFNNVLNTVGNGLQPLQYKNKYANQHEMNDDNNNDDDIKMMNNDQRTEIDEQQLVIYKEFCDEIGHNDDATAIGQKGIMYQVLAKNKTVSQNYCIKFLNDYFAKNIEPILENAKDYTAKYVLDEFTKLENMFYIECKGPAKEECWRHFSDIKLKQSVEYFKQMKGFNAKLIETEQKAAMEREKYRQIENVTDKQIRDMKHQQKLMEDDMSRINKRREMELKQYEEQLKQSKKRMEDMQSSQFVELAKSFQESTNAMNKQIIEIQQKNSKDTQEIIKMINSTLEAIKNRPPPPQPKVKKNWMNDLSTLVTAVAPIVIPLLT